MPQIKHIGNYKTIYARPDGIHYHLTNNCPELSDGKFEAKGYVLLTIPEVQKRHLFPCLKCCYRK